MQLKLLNELSTRLQSLLLSESIHQEIADIIQSRFKHYNISIWSVTADGAARLEAQAGSHRTHLRKGHTIPSGEGITGYVIRSCKTYLTGDVSHDPHYSNFSLPVRTRSELCVPIIKDGGTVGVLNVESDQPMTFDENDAAAFEAVASQVAVAMTNRRLYDDVRQFNRKLQKAVEEKTVELRGAHERILEQQKLLQRENRVLKTLVQQDQRTAEIITNSPAMMNLIGMVDKIAPTTATVLIQGESGTGKELVARRLHTKSERATGPYVTVNCGALQESLLESELFGHEKGSFTGAINQKLGLCETADGGTLFLDEIGEMSQAIQTKMLRFLQEGEFYRIGGKKPIKVDVRVISATNRDLELEVRESRFREDLYYRLNTITLRMLPLRKRKEDIALLVQHFLRHSRFGGAAQQIRRIDPRVMEVLGRYDWPGNIRELQNTIERLKILAENNEIRFDDIPFNIREPKQRAVKESDGYSPDMTLDDIEKSHILRALVSNQGNKTKAARTLGITIKTLYNKLHRYGILQSQSEPAGGAELT